MELNEAAGFQMCGCLIRTSEAMNIMELGLLRRQARPQH
jgi:hypothetical protein